MEGYIGTIALFAGSYAPKNWLFCNGRLLEIIKYPSLYSVITNQFGESDDKTLFYLPDLQGKVPIGYDTTGWRRTTNILRVGKSLGSEKVTLTNTNIPPLKGGFHDDTTFSIPCANTGSVNDPTNQNLGSDGSANIYSGGPVNGHLQPFNLNSAISGDHIVLVNYNKEPVEPISLFQPSLAINFIICYEGLYPDRPE